MTHTLNIGTLELNGACKPQCALLREIFPGGTIEFKEAHYAQVRDKQVNLLWGTALLPRAVQLELALVWYDRALTATSPSWKTSLRALVATPEGPAASEQLTVRLAERRSTDAADAAATSVAGVGYAAAALSGKFAETPTDPERNMTAMVVMAQWCAQASAIAEGKEMVAVLEEFSAGVWAALEAHGATLPI